VNVRDSERDGLSRGKHSREDVRDDRYSVSLVLYHINLELTTLFHYQYLRY